MGKTMNKPSELHGVMLYLDNCEAVHHLSDEEAGKLFKCIAEYACGQEPSLLEGPLMSLFCMFRTQMERNRKNYAELCDKNKKKAQLRWQKVNQQEATDEKAREEHAAASAGIPQNTDACLNSSNHNYNSNKNDDVSNTSIIQVLSDGEDFDELSFDHLWELYGKKEGNKESLRATWLNLPVEDRRKAMEYVPLYVSSTPDVKYRKYLVNFLNQRIWESHPLNVNGNNHSNNLTYEARRNADRKDAISIMQDFIEEG